MIKFRIVWKDPNAMKVENYGLKILTSEEIAMTKVSITIAMDNLVLVLEFLFIEFAKKVMDLVMFSEEFTMSLDKFPACFDTDST